MVGALALIYVVGVRGKTERAGITSHSRSHRALA
jgi:hypothetical protein